jgi:hypothetical protein
MDSTGPFVLHRGVTAPHPVSKLSFVSSFCWMLPLELPPSFLNFLYATAQKITVQANQAQAVPITNL